MVPNLAHIRTCDDGCAGLSTDTNKENNVFKDALGVKGLGFKLHGNHACNHGSHDGNHHGNYHAEQLQTKSTTSNCNSVVKYFSKQVSVRSSTNHQDRETSNGDHPVDKVGTIPRN